MDKGKDAENGSDEHVQKITACAHVCNPIPSPKCSSCMDAHVNNSQLDTLELAR